MKKLKFIGLGVGLTVVAATAVYVADGLGLLDGVKAKMKNSNKCLVRGAYDTCHKVKNCLPKINLADEFDDIDDDIDIDETPVEA